MKFTGHERDLASAAGPGDDLDYMHARFCSPLTGRLTSFDPIGGNPSAPQSWNRYSYALNRPLTYVDPYGLFGVSMQGLMALQRARFTFGETITVVGSLGSGYDLSGFYRFFFGAAPGSGGGGVDDPFRLTLGERLLAATPNSLAQGTGDAIVGFGDTISFGMTEWVRGEQGLENTVDASSTAYTAGEWTGYGWFAATGAAGVGRAATTAGLQGRVGLHGAHHTFRQVGLGRLPHIQLNVWRVGVKGSGISIRIPLPKWVKR